MTKQPLEMSRQPLEVSRQPLQMSRQPVEMSRQRHNRWAALGPEKLDTEVQ